MPDPATDFQETRDKIKAYAAAKAEQLKADELATIRWPKTAMLNTAWPTVEKLLPKAVDHGIDDFIVYFESLKGDEVLAAINSLIAGKKAMQAKGLK